MQIARPSGRSVLVVPNRVWSECGVGNPRSSSSSPGIGYPSASRIPDPAFRLPATPSPRRRNPGRTELALPSQAGLPRSRRGDEDLMPSYWFEPKSVSFPAGTRTMTVETGRLAKQAAGAALVSYGETVVLVTATSAKPREGIDFFPLTVDFVEKTSAAGKIPGGFFKREGRLSDREVLVSRFIDRSIRPLFADGYRDETQITATVLSADGQNFPDIAAFVGASAALTISDIPFLGPIGAVRVARIDGQFVANPLKAQLEKSDLELVVAGSRAALVMVEGGMKRGFGSGSCSTRSASPTRTAAADRSAGRTATCRRSSRSAKCRRRRTHRRSKRASAAWRRRPSARRRASGQDAALRGDRDRRVGGGRDDRGRVQARSRELRQPRGRRDAAQRARQTRGADQEHPARPALRGGARAHPRGGRPHRRSQHHRHPADRLRASRRTARPRRRRCSRAARRRRWSRPRSAAPPTSRPSTR